MPHSNFKYKFHTLSLGVGKCSCGPAFDYASERDWKVKFRLHLKFCSKPPKGFDEIGVSKARPAEKATMLKEYYTSEAEKMRKLYE